MQLCELKNSVGRDRQAQYDTRTNAIDATNNAKMNEIEEMTSLCVKSSIGSFNVIWTSQKCSIEQ